MSENMKQLKARVSHKHKTEAEWYLDVYTSAGGSTLRADPFIPLNGELIIFDTDSNHPNKRFKFGDGITNVIDLPFVAEGDFDFVITGKTMIPEYVFGELDGYRQATLTQLLEDKYGKVYVVDMLVDSNYEVIVPEAITYIEFSKNAVANSNYPAGFYLKGAGKGCQVVRNLIGGNNVTISGFKGGVEHCHGDGAGHYIENCNNISHCTVQSLVNCSNITDCTVFVPMSMVPTIENCHYINNLILDNAGEIYYFTNCSHLSNISCLYPVEYDEFHYDGCTYVDPYTCVGFVPDEDVGKVRTITADGSYNAAALLPVSENRYSHNGEDEVRYGLDNIKEITLRAISDSEYSTYFTGTLTNLELSFYDLESGNNYTSYQNGQIKYSRDWIDGEQVTMNLPFEDIQYANDEDKEVLTLATREWANNKFITGGLNGSASFEIPIKNSEYSYVADISGYKVQLAKQTNLGEAVTYLETYATLASNHLTFGGENDHYHSTTITQSDIVLENYNASTTITGGQISLSNGRDHNYITLSAESGRLSISKNIDEYVTLDNSGISYGVYDDNYNMYFGRIEFPCSSDSQTIVTTSTYEGKPRFEVSSSGMIWNRLNIDLFNYGMANDRIETKINDKGIYVTQWDGCTATNEEYLCGSYALLFPTDLSSSQTIATREWVQANVSGGSGLGDGWSVETGGMLTYFENKYSNAVRLRIEGYTNYVDLVQNQGLHIVSDDPGNASSTLYSNGYILYNSPILGDGTRDNGTLTFPHHDGEIFVQQGTSRWQLNATGMKAVEGDTTRWAFLWHDEQNCLYSPYWLAAPQATGDFERVPVIKRGTYGLTADEMYYYTISQGTGGGTLPQRTGSGALRGNCTDAILEALANESTAARDQCLINYGYLSAQNYLKATSTGSELPGSIGKLVYRGYNGSLLANYDEDIDYYYSDIYSGEHYGKLVVNIDMLNQATSGFLKSGQNNFYVDGYELGFGYEEDGSVPVVGLGCDSSAYIKVGYDCDSGTAEYRFPYVPYYDSDYGGSYNNGTYTLATTNMFSISPKRLPNAYNKIQLKAGHKYYITSSGCKIVDSNGETHSEFSNSISTGIIVCGNDGETVGDNSNHNSGQFRGFIITMSGLNSTSRNIVLNEGEYYIENQNSSVAWIYVEGPQANDIIVEG